MTTKSQISVVYRKIFRAILESLGNYKQDRKPLIQKVLQEVDKGNQRFSALLKTDPQLRQLFQDSFVQFSSWEESFKKVAKEQQREDLLQKIDIGAVLLQIQPKIKLNNLHNSYFIALITALKKYPEIESEFVKKVKEQKIIIKEEKIQKTKANRNLAQQEKIIQGPVPPTQINKQKETKNISGKQRELIKARAAEIAKKTRQLRVQNLSKFLQSKKQFSFTSKQCKQSIVKEILSNLERFMKDKMQSIIKATKLRMTGYEDDQTGDQFRYYSNKNEQIFKNSRHLMIPETDIRILKLRYPSKLEKYFNLRVHEEKQQQKLKNQIKQRMQTDKKNDKVIQKYILADQGESNHEMKHDEGPKKRQRLIIPSQVIQYIIETDPWFGDMQVMERTFYRGST